MNPALVIQTLLNLVQLLLILAMYQETRRMRMQRRKLQRNLDAVVYGRSLASSRDDNHG